MLTYNEFRDNGYLKLRRNIWAHFEEGRMTLIEFNIYLFLLLAADIETGTVMTNAPALVTKFRGELTKTQCQRSLDKLEQKHYIQRSHKRHGERGLYKITIDKFEITEGVDKGKLVKISWDEKTTTQSPVNQGGFNPYSNQGDSGVESLVCDCSATDVRLMCDCSATDVRLMCDCSATVHATEEKLISDLARVTYGGFEKSSATVHATDVRLMCDCSATDVRLMCDCYNTDLRPIQEQEQEQDQEQEPTNGGVGVSLQNQNQHARPNRASAKLGAHTRPATQKRPVRWSMGEMHDLRLSDDDFDVMDYAFGMATDEDESFRDIQRAVWYHWREIQPAKRYWADPKRGRINSKDRLYSNLQRMLDQVPDSFELPLWLFENIPVHDLGCEKCGGVGSFPGTPDPNYEAWMRFTYNPTCECQIRHPYPWRLDPDSMNGTHEEVYHAS